MLCVFPRCVVFCLLEFLIVFVCVSCVCVCSRLFDCVYFVFWGGICLFEVVLCLMVVLLFVVLCPRICFVFLLLAVSSVVLLCVLMCVVCFVCRLCEMCVVFVFGLCVLVCVSLFEFAMLVVFPPLCVFVCVLSICLCFCVFVIL